MRTKSESQAEVDLKVEKATELFKEQLPVFSECRGKLASNLQGWGRKWEAHPPPPVPQLSCVFHVACEYNHLFIVDCSPQGSMQPKIRCLQERLTPTIGQGDRKVSLRIVAFQRERNSTRGKETPFSCRPELSIP